MSGVRENCPIKLCACGKWKPPAHVVLQFPKGEGPPSSVRFHLACPECGASIIGVIAKDPKKFAEACELGEGAWSW